MKDIALSSTIHAEPNIIRNEAILLKLMWTTFLLISSTCCFYEISKSVNSYLSREIVTFTDTYSESPTEFPSVSICNLNPFVTDYAIDKLKQFKSQFFLTRNQSKDTNTKTELYAYSMNEQTRDANRKKYSYPLKDILIECIFDSKNCTADDFHWYYDTFYGNCFTFNNGIKSNGTKTKILKSRKAGALHGLRIQLFIGNHSNVDEMIESNGVQVNIYNSTVNPRQEEGIHASSGEQTKIVIDKHFDTNLPDPYSGCLPNLDTSYRFDSEFYQYFIKLNKTYNQNDCQKICFNSELSKRCNCHEYLEDSEVDYKLCSYMDFCYQNLIENFRKNAIERCLSLCPYECDTVSYFLFTSHSDFPTLKYADVLRTLPIIKSKFSASDSSSVADFNKTIKIDYYDLKESIVSIQVMYDDLSYTKTDQIRKTTWEDLVSNLGGLIGLFMGASFLSLAEILEVIFKMISILLEKK